MQDIQYPTRKCDIGSAHGKAKLDSGSRDVAAGYLRVYRARQSSSCRPVVEGIYERAQVLSEFPQIGHRYEGITDREVRILLYGHYRIAYLIKSEEEVDILGVFHGALDIQRYLI